jgi:hypothetical protein
VTSFALFSVTGWNASATTRNLRLKCEPLQESQSIDRLSRETFALIIFGALEGRVHHCLLFSSVSCRVKHLLFSV